MSSSSALFALRTTLRLSRLPAPLAPIPVALISRTPRTLRTLRHSSQWTNINVDSPIPIPTPVPHPISSSTLQRLHLLSALNPPVANSSEEKELISELSSLIGLMDLVKDVELPNGPGGMDERSELLSQGVGHVYITENDDDDNLVDRDGGNTSGSGIESGGENERKEIKGRQLMEWATNSLGDYYASRIRTK